MRSFTFVPCFPIPCRTGRAHLRRLTFLTMSSFTRIHLSSFPCAVVDHPPVFLAILAILCVPQSPFIQLRHIAASSATCLGIAAYAAMYALHWASSPVPPLECSAVRMLGIQCCCMWLGTFRSYATRLCWAVLRTCLSFPFHGYAEHSSLLPPTYLASCLRSQSQ